MSRWLRPIVVAAAALAVLPATAMSYSKKDRDRNGDGKEDTARYILPPGNYGGLPTNSDSLDQLPLYDSLTPLRGNVTEADIETSSCRRTSSPSARPVRSRPGGRACG